MNRRLLNALLVLVTVLLSTGCFPLGPRRGQERVIATRTLGTGGTCEKIVAAPTEHHWMLLIAPDGPELNYVLSETWRYYYVGPDARRVSLHFLKHRGFDPWERLHPLANTDLWVAERYTGSLGRLEHGHNDYRVICFAPTGVRTDKKLDFPENGELSFNSDTHMFVYHGANATWTYDPLRKSDPQRQPAPARPD